MKAAELIAKVNHFIWGAAPPAASAWTVRAQRLVRAVLVLVRDLATGELTLRAMSLVYTTLLSIVPLLALSFSVLKAFGVYNQIEPMMLNLLAPLGEKGEEVTQQILQFIGNMNVGVLGSVGLALLIYTAVSLVQKIEMSFNFIWHVPHARSFGERFSRYLTMLLVGPILVFSAMGVTATVMNLEMVRSLLALEQLGQTIQAASRLVPYLLVIAAFTFAYVFIPNTKVRLGAALAGGVVGGILWQTAGWVFAEFVAASTRYTAIYAGFAVLILFMIWLYLSWLILLLGASVAFYVQHPEYLLAQGGAPHLSDRMRERLALALMSLIAGRFLAGKPALSLAELSQTFRVPGTAAAGVLDALRDNGLLVLSEGDPPGYMPARDISLISVQQVLESVRAAGEVRSLKPSELPVPAQVDRVLHSLEQAWLASVENKSVKDLAAEAPFDPATGETGAVMQKTRAGGEGG